MRVLLQYLALALAAQAAAHAPEQACVSSDRSAPPALRLVFIRHAESHNNVLNLVSTDYYRENRLADPPITPLGQEQARAVARFISESRSGLLQHISEIHVSPTLRTLQTAQPIVHQLVGVKAIVDVSAFEVGGVYDQDARTGAVIAGPGLARAEMSAGYAYELPDAVTSTGWYAFDEASAAAKGKESRAEGATRAAALADRYRQLAASLTESKTIALVSHGDFIGAILTSLLGQGCDPARPGVAFKVYNTAVSVVDIRADGSVLVLMVNSVSHLESNQYRPAHLGRV